MYDSQCSQRNAQHARCNNPRETGGGTFPRWSRDGKELFYMTPDGDLMTVPVKTTGRFSAGKPEKLFPLPGGRIVYRRPYAVSADSRRFLIAVPEDANGSDRLVVITNWMRSLPQN